MHFCPTSPPCSFPGRLPVLYTILTQLLSGAQSMSEEKASSQGVSMWLWSSRGPRCFPPGKQWSHPIPGTKMSDYSSENAIWYIIHIWHDFPSYAAGICQIKSLELQWCKACINKVRIRHLSVRYSLMVWEAERFPLSDLYSHLFDFSENSAIRVNLLQPTILMQYMLLSFRKSELSLEIPRSLWQSITYYFSAMSTLALNSLRLHSPLIR